MGSWVRRQNPQQVDERNGDSPQVDGTMPRIEVPSKSASFSYHLSNFASTSFQISEGAIVDINMSRRENGRTTCFRLDGRAWQKNDPNFVPPYLQQLYMDSSAIRGLLRQYRSDVFIIQPEASQILCTSQRSVKKYGL